MSLPSVEAIEAELIRRELRRRGIKYNEDEPRVPAGSPEGGEWTTNPGGDEAPSAPASGRLSAVPTFDEVTSPDGARALQRVLTSAMGTPEAQTNVERMRFWTKEALMKVPHGPQTINGRLLKGTVAGTYMKGIVDISPHQAEKLREFLALKTPAERVERVQRDERLRVSIQTLAHEMTHGIGPKVDMEYATPGQVRIEEAMTEYLAQTHWETFASRLAGAPVGRRPKTDSISYRPWVDDLAAAGHAGGLDRATWDAVIAKAHNLDTKMSEKTLRFAKAMRPKATAAEKKSYGERLHAALDTVNGKMSDVPRQWPT